MASTIFTAKDHDPVKERRRRNFVIGLILVALLSGVLAWNFRYWPEERRVDKFFDALERKDYETAYGIWFNDPAWKQHPGKYKQYPFKEFYIDWGPGGEWGLIKNHKVEGAVSPKRGSSGVVVLVTVNERIEKARIWVEKKDKTLTFSPY